MNDRFQERGVNNKFIKVINHFYHSTLNSKGVDEV